jgi:glycosyltransferase involved in cell wall biosynthesis
VKFLLLNQTFRPDVMATGQYLTEVALELVKRGHQVTVVTSRRAYDGPAKEFTAHEVWKGVRIHRVGSTGFGKGARWRRASDFASFMLLCALRLVLLPKADVIVALTSPPLISFLGALMAKLRGARFVYWVMDFNPDEAIAAGWLRAGSPTARLLEAMSRFSLRQASGIIALDRFMRDRIVAKGIARDKISVIPPWSHDEAVRFDVEARDRFRRAHNLNGKFVVMHSGNHSPCHPLDTLLEAAKRQAGDPDIVFCFVGGGSEFRRIQKFVQTQSTDERFSNIRCFPYQPLDDLAASLSAADLHVVVMGSAFVGLVHPCKIYNVLSVRAPVLYIGPPTSHISDIIQALDGEPLISGVRHGDVDGVIEAIACVREKSANRQPVNANSRFSQATLLSQLIQALEK